MSIDSKRAVVSSVLRAGVIACECGTGVDGTVGFTGTVAGAVAMAAASSPSSRLARCCTEPEVTPSSMR